MKKYLFAILATLALTACGGGGSSTEVAADVSTSGTTSQTGQTLSSTAPGQTDSTKLLDSLAVLYPKGQLPVERAAQATQDLAQNPAALKFTADAALDAAAQTTQSQAIEPQAVAADYQPVQRVQNTTLYGAYFFSIYPSEITTALATNPNWRLEGPAFWASLATGSELYPVHRFRNKTNGSYLYSIYETERADIATNYAATFAYEGVAWYARQTPATGWSALYRFRNKTNGTYLFSAYESEKNAIVATYPDVFALEGIAYYVRQENAAPVANAGGAQNVLVGNVVTLNGSGSSDANGDTLTYMWTGSRPTGSSATLIGASTVAPTFTADIAGTYVISLVVSDGKASSVPATVTITASAPLPAAVTLYLYSGETTPVYLGCLTCNQFHVESVCNKFGTYGSEFQSRSIWNQFGTYGSQFNTYSAWNQFSSNGPAIIGSDNLFYGYFTVNNFRSNRTTIQSYVNILNFYSTTNNLASTRTYACGN